MSTDGLSLTGEQAAWLQHWLSLWGAWVYSGRIERRQSSIIAERMATVERRDYPHRPVCSDDDGMLINNVIDALYKVDRVAHELILLRYEKGTSDRAIARYYFAAAEARFMARRGGRPGYRRPSLTTCRREVTEILRRAEYLIYQPIKDAFINSEKSKKCIQRAKTC